jgi:hypothetical protein
METELIKPPSKEVVERVRGEFGLNEERVLEAVEHLKDWIQLQPHLPKEIGKLHASATEPCSFQENTHIPLLKTNMLASQTIIVPSWNLSSIYITTDSRLDSLDVRNPTRKSDQFFLLQNSMA